MSDYEFKMIDNSDKQQVEMFEKAFYRVFHEQKSDSWSEKHYVVNESTKCISHSMLSLDDMSLYVIVKDDKLLGGAAVNLSTKKVVTFSDMGVNILPSDLDSNVAEALNLFLFEEVGKDFFKLFMLFSGFIFSDLKKKGIKHLYGKCPEKLISMYGLVGFEEVEMFTFKEASLCLVKADVENEG